MTESPNNLARLLFLAEQNHTQIKQLYEAVMGDGNPRDSIMYRLQAVEHSTSAMRKELTVVHCCVDDLERSFSRDRNRLLGATSVVLILWSIITFIGYQHILSLVQP